MKFGETHVGPRTLIVIPAPARFGRTRRATSYWLHVLSLFSLLLMVSTPLIAREEWKRIQYDPGARTEIETRPPMIGSWMVEEEIPATLLGVVAVDTGTVIAVGDQGVVLRSTDNGKSWSHVGGKADAALLSVTATNLGTLIAVGDAGTVLRSTDDGKNWDQMEKTTHATLLGVAVAAKTGALIAVGNQGAILRSIDDGKNWNQVDKKTVAALWSVVVTNTGTVIAVGDQGAMLRSTDSGETWSGVSDRTDATLWAVASTDAGTLIAVGDQNTVLRSADEGINWKWVSTETDRATFRGVVATHAGILIAVGDQGAVLRSTDDGQFWTRDRNNMKSTLNGVTATHNSGRMIAVSDREVIIEQPQLTQTAVAATEIALSSADETLSLFWRYPPQQSTTCERVFYRAGKEESEVSIDVQPSHTIDEQNRLTYTITWSPRTQIAANTPIHYVVECVDPILGVTWRQPLLSEAQVWTPYPGLWKQLQDLSSWKLAGLVAVTLLLLWVLMLLLLYAVFPAVLVILHELMQQSRVLDDAASRFDKFFFGFVALVLWLGQAIMFFLGTSRRALDAWIAGRLPKAREIFLALPVVYDRRISIELPVRIERKKRDQPWDVVEQLFSQPTTALLISGPGGAGKTTLACRVARRAMGEDGRAPLAGYPILPLLIEQDIPEEAAADGLRPYLAGLLRPALGQSRMISPALMGALLNRGRVMPIVDGFSERSMITRRAFDSSRQGFPATKFVVTSRETALSGSVVVEMQTIPPGALYDFIERYLSEMTRSGADPMPSGDRILQASADLLRLLRDTPTTPLLATMWAGEIAKPVPDQARGVADLMDRYVRRVLLPPSGGDEALVERLRADAAAIAAYELGMGFQPGYVTRGNSLRILRELDPQKPERRLDLLVKSRLLEDPSHDSDALRVAPDPVAEHMVARQRAESLGSDLAGWHAFIDNLRKADWPQGFLAALRACLDHHVYGPPVPIVIRKLLRTGAPIDGC